MRVSRIPSNGKKKKPKWSLPAEYQQGGRPVYVTDPNDPLSKQTDSVKSNLYNYMLSPDYLRRLSFSTDNPEKLRAERFLNVISSPVTDGLIPDKLGKYGEYNPRTHSTAITKGAGDDALLHELIHAQTRAWGLNPKEINIISQAVASRGEVSLPDEEYAYLSTPTEYHARLGVLREYARKKGLVEGYGDITETEASKIIDQFKKDQRTNDGNELGSLLYKDAPGAFPQYKNAKYDALLSQELTQIEQLLKVTKPKDRPKVIAKLWNTLADNSAGETVPIASHGGKLDNMRVSRIPDNKKKQGKKPLWALAPKYQLGGSFLQQFVQQQPVPTNTSQNPWEGLDFSALSLDGIDFSNYEDVLGAAFEAQPDALSKIRFGNAVVSDDPTKYTSGVTRQLGNQIAGQDAEARYEQMRSEALAGKTGHQRRVTEDYFNTNRAEMTRKWAMEGQELNANTIQGGYSQANSLIDFLGALQFQQGGKPIYVSDPNDPRLRAYQDSLALYNSTVGEISALKEIEKRGFNGLDEWREHTNKWDLANKKASNAYYDLVRLNNEEPAPIATYENRDIGEAREFKKPVQPVLFQQPKREQVNIEKLPNVPLKQLIKERPLPDIDNIENGIWEKGRLIQDWKGVPGLQVVSAKNKKTGELEPIAIKNRDGKQIDWDKYKDKPLPKGFQYPEQMQQGGSMSQLGYSDGSPYRGMPQITIPGNNITMAQTGMPLMAIPNVGQPKIMAPYSGNHLFPGASSVREIPLFQEGGPTSTEVLRERNDPWEYQKVNGTWQTRKIGNKTWIKPTGLALAAIKDRYEPQTLNPAEKKLVDAYYSQEAKKTPLPGTIAPTTNQFSFEGSYDPTIHPATPPQSAVPDGAAGITFQGRQFQVNPINNATVPLGQSLYGYGVTDERGNTFQGRQFSVNPVNNQQVPVGQSLYGYGVTDDRGNIPASEGEYMSVFNRMAPLYGSMLMGSGMVAGNRFIHPTMKVITEWAPRAARTARTARTANNYNKLFKKGGKKKKYYQEGGPGEMGAVGAQLEKGEVFATPEADIMDTAATEMHKDMKKDKITDVLGPQDYVFSVLDRHKVTRKEAEDMVFGLGGVLYEEGDIPDQPQEASLVDLFRDGEKEVQVVELMKRLRSKYKVRDEDMLDVFSKKTNAGNKDSRVPFIEAVAALNEKKRTGKLQTGYASTFENLFATDITADARPVNRENAYAAYTGTPEEVQEMQEGGWLNLIPAVGGIIQGIGQLGSNRKNYRDTRAYLNRDRQDIQQLASLQSGYSGLSTLASLAGIVGQDPNVTAPNYDTTQLDASIRRTPRSLFDYQASRLSAASRPILDQLFRHSGTVSEAINSYAPIAAGNAASMAQLGVDQVNRDIGLENQYRGQKQSYADQQMLGNVAAENQTRRNSNQLVAGAAGVVSSGIGAQGNIQSNKINALRSNNAGQLQATMDWRQGKNQAWSNVIGATAYGADAASSALTNRSDPSTDLTNPANIPAVNNNPEVSHEGYRVPSGLPAQPRGINSPFYFQPPGGGQAQRWDPTTGRWAPYTPSVDSDYNMGPNVPQGYWDPVTGDFHFRRGGRVSKLPKRRY